MKFNGKNYRFFSGAIGKSDAKALAKVARRRGNLARIVKRESLIRGTRYSVYIRRR